MDLSKKLKSLEELEDEFNDQLDLHNLYNFSELDSAEISELTPLLNSIKIERKRYGEVIDSKCGGEKRIDKALLEYVLVVREVEIVGKNVEVALDEFPDLLSHVQLHRTLVTMFMWSGSGGISDRSLSRSIFPSPSSAASLNPANL